MIKLGESALIRHLTEQLQFIKISSTLFDNGVTIEARRLATCVSTLIIDTKSTTSLLTHLGWSPLFIDTGTMHRKFQEIIKADILNNGGNPGNLIPMGSPLIYHTNNPPCAKVYLSEGMEHADRLSKEEWLDHHVIFAPSGTLTRRQLISFLRNKDGGAHVDKDVKEGIHGIVREGTADFEITVEGIDVDVINTAELVMRQIAFEVEASILEHLNILTQTAPPSRP